jgi:uncharacterized protein YegL
MLDNSGSMTLQDKNGQSRWGSLIAAVSQFIAKLVKNPLLMSKSKISIITHNHEAKLEVEYKTPSFEYLDKL